MRHEFSAAALHGDLDQSARTAALDSFRKGDVKLLIASDVAARGLDIPDVSHVFNFDVPHHADDYVHRIGRTGRAGKSGTAITIVSPIDSKSLAAIEKLIGQTISWMGEPPRADEAEAPERHERPRHGRGHRSDQGRRQRATARRRGQRGPKPGKRRERAAAGQASRAPPAPVTMLDEARGRRPAKPTAQPESHTRVSPARVPAASRPG